MKRGGNRYDPKGRAQDGGDLLGEMLRIDIDGGSPYVSPPSNPLFRLAILGMHEEMPRPMAAREIHLTELRFEGLKTVERQQRDLVLCVRQAHLQRARRRLAAPPQIKQYHGGEVRIVSSPRLAA